MLIADVQVRVDLDHGAPRGDFIRTTPEVTYMLRKELPGVKFRDRQE